MGEAYSVRHAAALCDQLPRESRLAQAQDPSLRWPDEAYILARIEFDLQCIALRGSKRARPRMMRTPIDDARLERARRSVDKDALADALGIDEDRR